MSKRIPTCRPNKGKTPIILVYMIFVRTIVFVDDIYIDDIYTYI